MKQVFQIVPAGSSNSTCASIYPVKNMRLNRLAATLMVILLATPSLAITLGATAFTVETNKEEYEPGDEVKIRGTAEAGMNVTIDVIHDSAVLFHFNITAKGDGNYSDEFTLPDDEYGAFTVNASQGGVTAQTVFTVVDASERDLARGLIREARKLRDHVEEVFEELGEHDMEIPPEAEDNFTQGVEVLELAVADFEDGNFSDAAEGASLALVYFGDAFRLVQDEVAEVAGKPEVKGAREDEEEDEDEDEVEKAQELIVAIERALDYIEKVKATASKLGDEGYEIDGSLPDELESNRTALLELREQFLGIEGAGISNSDAAKRLAEIRGDIGRIMGLLHSTAAKAHKLEMAERFIEQVQNQIQGIKDKMQRLRDRLEAERVVRVGNSLGAVQRRVDRLRERIGSEDLDGLIDELQLELDDIVENLNELNGEGISTNLWAMNSIDARIRVLNATAERLKRKGEDTSEVEKQLELTTGLLEMMMERLLEGDSTEAQNILDEIMENYEELRSNVEPPILNQIKENFLNQIRRRLQD